MTREVITEPKADAILWNRRFVVLLTAQIGVAYANSSFLILPKFLATRLGAGPEAIHMTDQRRADVPPFFVFSKAGEFRAVEFHGVAVPGAPSYSESEDLVATWTTRGNDRFQNYRAIFTLLDIPIVERAWIEDVCRGERNSPTAPTAWREWVDSGDYTVLPPPSNEPGAD